MTAPGGTGIAFDFDGPLPTAVTWSGEVAGQVAYDYDSRFQVASVAVEGQAVSYGYDDDGLLTSAGALSIQREAASGLLDGTTLGSVATEAEHNAFGELAGETVAVSGSTLYDVSYQRDELGRIVERTETVDGVSHTRTYAYDAAGRLIEETRDGATLWSGSYDANGNRLTSNGVSASYDARDRLVSHGDITFEYTDDGRLKSKTGPEGTTDYDYDVLGNLLGVTLPDGTEIAYIVDGLNRRIGKKMNGELVQGFFYDGQWNPVAELESEGSVIARFVYGTRVNVPDYIIKNGTVFRIISDQVGSVRLVVNSSTGKVVQEMSYDAWGNVLKDTNPGFQPFGFAGGLYDLDTGLVRLGSRDYLPSIGAWATRDLTKFNGGMNGYSYVEPVNYIDWTGERGVRPPPRPPRHHNLNQMRRNTPFRSNVPTAREGMRRFNEWRLLRDWLNQTLQNWPDPNSHADPHAADEAKQNLEDLLERTAEPFLPDSVGLCGPNSNLPSASPL